MVWARHPAVMRAGSPRAGVRARARPVHEKHIRGLTGPFFRDQSDGEDVMRAARTSVCLGILIGFAAAGWATEGKKITIGISSAYHRLPTP